MNEEEKKQFLGLNYYQLLGVRQDASQEEIKQAYKVLALKYHPDTTQATIDPDDQEDSPEMFRLIHAAYKNLSKPALRVEYDKNLPPDLPSWTNNPHIKSNDKPGTPKAPKSRETNSLFDKFNAYHQNKENSPREEDESFGQVGRQAKMLKDVQKEQQELLNKIIKKVVIGIIFLMLLATLVAIIKR